MIRIIHGNTWLYFLNVHFTDKHIVKYQTGVERQSSSNSKKGCESGGALMGGAAR